MASCHKDTLRNLLLWLRRCILFYSLYLEIVSNDTIIFKLIFILWAMIRVTWRQSEFWLSVKSNPEFFFFFDKRSSVIGQKLHPLSKPIKCKTKTDCVFLCFRKLVCFSTLSSGKLCVVFRSCSGCSDYYVSRHSAVKRSYTTFRWRFQSVLTILLSRPTFHDPELDWSSV